MSDAMEEIRSMFEALRVEIGKTNQNVEKLAKEVEELKTPKKRKTTTERKTTNFYLLEIVDEDLKIIVRPDRIAEYSQGLEVSEISLSGVYPNQTVKWEFRHNEQDLDVSYRYTIICNRSEVWLSNVNRKTARTPHERGMNYSASVTFNPGNPPMTIRCSYSTTDPFNDGGIEIVDKRNTIAVIEK